jgi:hypothetical protein
MAGPAVDSMPIGTSLAPNLRSRVRSMSLEGLKSFFDQGALVLGLLTIIFGAGALYCGNRINKAQEAKLRQFEADILNAKTELEKQQERAATAERKLLEEEQHSANRDITAEDQRALSTELEAFGGQHAGIDVFPVTFESRWLAFQIWGILIKAKWVVSPPNLLSAPPIRMVQGVGIRSTPDEKSKKAASKVFELFGLTVASGVLDPDPLPDPSRPRIWILVGDKPTPLRSWVK